MEKPRTMWQALVSTASRWLGDINRTLLRPRGPIAPAQPASPPAQVDYQPLEEVRLTDAVGRTLFEEYAAHRAASRGEEETGWVLMGLRERSRAVVLATLPAGALRDASVSHVRFNSTAQALASCIVRQADRRLTILGVVHTHPGSLRHPSDGDFQGDSAWVRHLRGGEGVFAIGTADGAPRHGALFAEQPHSNVQTFGELRLSWYSLRAGEKHYRPLPVSVTLGPDLARPLHEVWSAVEAHAERLERLYRQQAGVIFDVVPRGDSRALAVDVPLAEPGAAVRAVLTEKEVRYYLLRDGQLLAIDHVEPRVDRGVYLLLAELATQE